MWKILVVAFVIGSFSSGTYSTSIPKSDSRYDRDVIEAGSPPAVEEYLQNLYNYRPQTTVLEEEADYRSYHNNFNPIGPAIPTPVNSPAPALDNDYMESRSRDNYNHYQPPLRGSQDRDRDHRGDRRPFPPNPPYLRDPQRAAATRAPIRPPLYQDDNDDGQGLPNNFQDPNQDDADDYNFSDLPDEDDVESDPPFPNLNPNARYNPNYNQRPPNRRPAQASCGGGSCGGGGGGKLPKPPGNLYDDQTGRERGDPSYRFGYDLHDQSRHENADRFGNVNGYFSFVDDEGTFNKVSYSAGAAKGFIVNHKEPADPPAAQPPQRTRAPNIRRNPNSDVGGGSGGGARRNSNHASSYPPRQHHNPFGNKQHNNQNVQNQLPNTLSLNSNNNNVPPLEDEVLSDGVGNVVGLPGINKGGGGVREGQGGDGWSRNKIAGVGTSTVVTTAAAASSVGVNTGNSHNNHSPHNSSDDPSSVNLNGTSDGYEAGSGDGGDGRPKGSWGSAGGNVNRPNQRPRQRKRKPAYVVKVKRPANNNNVPAWQYYKPPNPGRPAPGGGDNGPNNNNNWQHNQNNRPLPPQDVLPHSQDQDDLDGSLYDGSDGSDGSDDYDPYPKDKSYSFGYKTGDSTRQEASDAYGNIRGSYSYVDPAGLTRVVHYSAGNSGFKILNAQPSNLHPVYADSPLTVQSLQSIPIPVQVTSQLSQLRQPSAIVYHIHPDNGLGSEWKPWESSRVKSVGPVYHHSGHSRSRNNHQLAPLISSINPNPSNKRSRSPHRSRERSQKQQILQGNTFRLTHQNHRFFPAYNNIYDQAVRQSQLENVASASEDITLSPTFHNVNPDEVETIIGSNVINNGLDNSADIEANQQNLKQVQRQQIRQQNKLRRLSQQYQQQIISTPVFQYSRRHPNQSPRFNSPSSHGYYYRDRLQQYPSIGNDNEILWRPQDQQYSDYELSPSSIVSQSNPLSVNIPNSNSSNSSSPSIGTGTGTGRGIISTFPNSNNSSNNPNLNRRRSSRERGQKRSSNSNVNRNSIGNIRDKSVVTPNNLSSSSDSFVNGNANSHRNSNLMNITEILTSPGPGSVVLPHDVPPPSSSSLPNPIPTPPMTQQPLSLPITMTIPVPIEGGPGIQTYQGGYGDKNPLLIMSQRSQPQSEAHSSERGQVFSTGPRLQREIPLRTTQSMNSINNALTSVPGFPSLIPAVETDMVAMPLMPMGIVVPADNQMAESIINSVMVASSNRVHQGEEPGSLELMKINSKADKLQKFSSQNGDVGVPNLKLKKAETEESEAKPESSMKKVKTESEPIVRMSPAARLAAKMASPPSSSTSSSTSSPTLSTSTFSSGTEREGTPFFSAIALPMTMSNSGMVVHYPGGKPELGGVATVASTSSKEMMMMTA